ncbi:MAG: gamma-glutamyltransferase [Gemmatimonadota bacterium]|nr:gamma-glutamyltransferase [Gemmatimonadota bacterium]MDE3005394.1 gamma-glutamyltransferase [Gemmatimonadota bacterium]MDE3014604.1 gamma-glutamyltransferase [Gemmatimonadota bacterium]
MSMHRPHAPRLALTLAAAAAALVPATTSAQSIGQSGRSDAGMVSAAHPLATDAGVRMLELGGNAADAAVAAGFAIAVVEPTMNSIGGRNQILVHTPDGQFHGIDGTTQAPWDYDHETAPRASFGYAVIGIPGATAGLLKLHEEHGSLPLARVMAPAIEYAENGFRLLAGDARRQAAGAEQALQFPGTAATYYRGDGSPYGAGETLVQPDYAETLRKIMLGGRDVFYKGEIAQAMAADFRANGAVVDLEDLEQYVAEDSRIVRGTYRGYDIIGTDVPAAGVLAIQALHVMETFDPASMTEAEWFAITGQSLRMAQRELAILGPDTAAVRATSKEYARQIAADIAAPGQQPAEPWIPMPELEERGDLYGGHTTHLSTADANGMFVSLTQTLGPNMGSKVVTPGLGFLYASTLGGYLGTMTEPGMRARSNICPFIVMKDGEVVLVLGGAGGGMIPPAVVHAITRVIDFGMDLPHALAEPRVAGGFGGGLNAETSPGIGWTEEEIAQMEALGLDINEQPRTGAFGRIHGIQYDPDTRTFIGGADPDWEGTARGPMTGGS